MDKCELEAKNYHTLLEWAAAWRNPHGALERIKRFAHEKARQGRSVERMRSRTLVKIFEGQPRGINAPTAAPAPESPAPPCTPERKPGHLRVIDGGGPRSAA